MIATSTARRQEQAEQTPRRDPIGFLLLAGIEWTDERPWFGFVGAAVAGVVFAVIKARFL